MSRAGVSDVVLEFTWDTEMTDAIQDSLEKIDLVFLPDEAERPLILRFDPTLDPVLEPGAVQVAGALQVGDQVGQRLDVQRGIAQEAVRIGQGNAPLAPDHHRFEILAAHDRADAAPARLPPEVVGDAREHDAVLARRADREEVPYRHNDRHHLPPGSA